MVAIGGLVNAPPLDGLAGRVLGFDSSSGRYKVELGRNEVIRKIKRTNLATTEELDKVDDSNLSCSGAECFEKSYFLQRYCLCMPLSVHRVG